MTLQLRVLRPACAGNTECMDAEFTVENRTGKQINFDARVDRFYLDFGGPKQYLANNAAILSFNNFDDRSSRNFEVLFPISVRDYDAARRNPDVKYVEVVADGFDSRLSYAVWQDEVNH